MGRQMSVRKPDENLFKPKTLNLSSSKDTIKQPFHFFDL